MYKDFIGEKVTFVVTSRGGENITVGFQYVGTLKSENAEFVELTDITISGLLLPYGKGLFGESVYNFK